MAASPGSFSSPNDALRALRREIHEAGLDRPPVVRLFTQLFSHLLIMTLGILGSVLLPWLLKPVALFVLVVGTLGAATCIHTASHHGFSRSARVNRGVAYWGYTVLLGLGACYWRHRHITLHHRHPNEEGVDQDVEQQPWFSLSESQLERLSPRAARINRLQRFYWPFVLVGNGPAVKLSALIWTVREWFRAPHRRPELGRDLAGFALHYGFWLALPLIWFPFWQAALFHLVWVVGTGYALFVTFVPAHWPAEAEQLPADHGLSFAEHQTRTTVNFTTGPIGSFFICGLQYQIEHHLFPAMPHTAYPKIAPMVRELCESQGLPYRTASWGRMLLGAVKVLYRPKQLSVSSNARS